VSIHHFDGSTIPPEKKPYTLGVLFEYSYIEKTITSIENKFYRTFLVLFVAPFVAVTLVFLISEVLLIIWFTNRIFITINELYDKIDLLNL
jgi:hypothetical protein